MNATLLATVILVLFALPAGASEKADRVLVEKSDRLLLLYKNNSLIGAYRIALGGHPTGHKLREGDRRTPEGSYLLDHKEPAGKYYKSIRISYPNAYDRMLAQGRGAPPGEEVVIHGQRPAFEYLSPLTRKLDWTNGSIALSNRDMDKVWAAVDPGTPVEIKP